MCANDLKKQSLDLQHRGTLFVTVIMAGGIARRAGQRSVAEATAVRGLAALIVLVTACSVGGGGGYGGLSAGVGSATAMSGTAENSGSTSSETGATGGDTGPADSSGAADNTGSSAGANESSSPTSAATSSAESSDEDATAGTGTPLDPMLDVPDAGDMCTTPGSLSECPGVAVCRFATVEYGLCESCEPCGNLNAPCVEGTDCDILFSCYAGRCTNFCTLGSFECGPPDDCLDIGHPTRGVCDPFA